MSCKIVNLLRILIAFLYFDINVIQRTKIDLNYMFFVSNLALIMNWPLFKTNYVCTDGMNCKHFTVQ